MINPTELGIERKKRYDQNILSVQCGAFIAVDSKSDYQMIDSPFASTSAYKALQTDTALLPIPRPVPKPSEAPRPAPKPSGTKTGRKFRVS